MPVLSRKLLSKPFLYRADIWQDLKTWRSLAPPPQSGDLTPLLRMLMWCTAPRRQAPEWCLWTSLWNKLRLLRPKPGHADPFKDLLNNNKHRLDTKIQSFDALLVMRCGGSEKPTIKYSGNATIRIPFHRCPFDETRHFLRLTVRPLAKN